MNSRIELLMAVARLQEEIRTVSDARAAKGDDVRLVRAPLALGRTGSASPGDQPCAADRGQP
jgi:hypothetical protein